MTRSHWTITTLLGLSLAGTLGSAGCGKAAPEAKPKPPAPVTVVAAESRDVPDQRRYPGTTQAVEEISLVARVEGFLERRLFEEGTDVAAGDLMFVIEQAPYEAAVLQARGAVREAEAQVADSRLIVERNRPLAESGAVSRQDFDRQLADLAVAEGRFESARAAMIEAEIQLGYTEVRTPVAGRAGRRLVDVGNLVGDLGGPSELATVVALDPIRVVFEPAGREAADFLAAWPSTEVKVVATVPGSTASVTLQGSLDLVDNAADTGTSTFTARATFPNPDGRVIPGLAVDLDVTLGMMKDRIVVPAQAIRLDPQHAFVWIVDDGKLARKIVELGASWQGLRVIEGVDAGTKIVVQANPMALRTGASVKATSESIDDFLKSAKKAEKAAAAGDPAAAHPAQSPTAKVSSGHSSGHSGGGA